MRKESPQREGQAARLREARAKAGFDTPSAAIEKWRWKQSTYMAHENGQNGIRPEPALEYAKAFGVDPGWILTGVGKGPTAPAAQSSEGLPRQIQRDLTIIGNERRVPELNPATWPRDVPFYVGAVAGKDGLIEFNGIEFKDFGKRPPRLVGVKDAYGLYVIGTSMERWRHNMEEVYVHPHLPVKPGDHVVVQLKQTEPGGQIPAYIKRLVRRTAKEVMLFQYNPEKEISIPTNKIWAIHRILEWRELLEL